MQNGFLFASAAVGADYFIDAPQSKAKLPELGFELAQPPRGKLKVQSLMTVAPSASAKPPTSSPSFMV
jgi:hypothetical protein